MTHWAAAWAMILALYFGLSAVYGNGSRQETFAAHAYAGLTVLALVVIRLFLRTLLPWPKEKNGGSRFLQLVAEAMHWTLYALMLLTPLTGWIVAIVDGMLHGRSRVTEYRPSRLRPFHRPSG
jgi:cytochrome b561